MTTLIHQAPTPKAVKSSDHQIGALLLRYNFLFIFVAVLIVGSFLSPDFLTTRNIANLFQQASVVGIVAVGMTFVILTSNIDLSVGSMVALGGMIASLMMAAGWNPIISALVAMAVGSSVGAGIGAICAYAAVPSFIVTLAGLVTVRGVTFLLSDGVPVGGLPAGFGHFGSLSIPLGHGVGFPVLGLLFIVICILSSVVLRFTVFGEYVFATGGNAEAARLSGLPVKLMVTGVFAISGFLAASSGVLLAARLRIGQPTAAQGLELDAIAAVVLGGTSLFGGRGGILGTAVAVMLLQVLRNIFNLLGLGSFYQMTVTGLIIIAAVLLNRAIDVRQG